MTDENVNQRADSKHLQTVVNKMLNQAGGEDLSGLTNIPAEALVHMMQQLETGLVELSRSQQLMAHAVDTARLSIQMIMRILVKQKVLTEDEIRAQYTKEVEEPLNKVFEEMRVKMAQAIQKNKQEGSDDLIIMEAESTSQDDEAEVESDIVLASEKAEKKVFPAGDKDS